MFVSSLPSRLALFALLSFSTSVFLFRKSRRLRKQRLTVKEINIPNLTTPLRKPKLFFASQTGTSEALARNLHVLLASNGIDFDLVDPRSYEPEDLPKESLVLIVVSTWDDGNPPPSMGFLYQWLSESTEDFRIGKSILSGCKFAAFGVGSRSYGEERFNAAAKGFSRWMRALGAMEMVGVGVGDVDEGDVNEIFEKWSGDVVAFLMGDGVLRENGGVVVNSESEDDQLYDDDSDQESDVESDVVDLEDIAGKGPTRKSGVVKENGEKDAKTNGLRDMVTPVIRTSLQKQVSFFIALFMNYPCNQTFAHKFAKIDVCKNLKSTQSLKVPVNRLPIDRWFILINLFHLIFSKDLWFVLHHFTF